MKKFAIAAAIVAVSAAAVHAGSPVVVETMEPMVIVEATEAASSATTWIIPLILLALVVAAGL